MTGAQAQTESLELANDKNQRMRGLQRADASGSSAGYTVGLADNLDENKLDATPTNSVYKTAPVAKPMPAPAHASPKKGIDVTTPQLALKEDRDGDVDDAPPARKLTKAKDARPDGRFESGAPGAGGGAATPSPPPPATIAMQPAQPAAPTPQAPPADKAGEQTADRRGGDSTVLAWAAGQLQQVVQLAKDNKCDDAAKVAAAISARAPDFYAQNVATNRDLKACMAYIAAAHDCAEKAAADKAAAAAHAASRPTSTSK